MKAEKKYDFRSRLDNIHFLNRRNTSAVKLPNEFELCDHITISIPNLTNQTITHAAEDLQDYLLKSMGISARIVCNDLKADICMGQDAAAVQSEGGYRFTVTEKQIFLTGNEAKGIFNASIHLEDLLNLREAPYLTPQSEIHKKLFTPRMVHSGWGIDLFPDSHLNAMAHAGFDTAVVFITAIDHTNTAVLDINNLIHRAAIYGIDVMLYSYFSAYKHPNDENAQAFFDQIYTKLFEYYPDAKGIMLVGESADFPSKDPRVCQGDGFTDSIPSVKPRPGWFPCRDYPAWLTCVSKAIRKAKPDALIIFNTYNWGWTEKNLRKEFLQKFPKDIILQVTFEIFKKIMRENQTCCIMDYTISTAEPGFYFTSECKMASELGIKLLATANTAGATWDFGTIAHVPVPQQWIRKFKHLDNARKTWGLSGLYDNHHYGWEPSVITDLGRAFFWSPQIEPETLLPKLARRDFGHGAANVLAAWDKWSKAIQHYTATNEDQYGPFRVGPSYPFIFHPNITRTMSAKEITFPTQKDAHFGNRIIKTMYQPYENNAQVPGSIRIRFEIRSLEKMKDLWQEGLAIMAEALPQIESRKKENLESEISRGQYILTNIQTTLNIKHWYLLNITLLNASTPQECQDIITKIRIVAQGEIDNAKRAIPCVERDSRLGWEPSMEYVTDRWHIEWKLRQMESMLREVDAFEKIIHLQ